MPKRDRNLRPKKSRLGTDLGRSGLVSERLRKAKMLIFYCFFPIFPENPRFSGQEVSGGDPGTKKTEKGPRNGSQNDPRTAPKRPFFEDNF